FYSILIEQDISLNKSQKVDQPQLLFAELARKPVLVHWHISIAKNSCKAISTNVHLPNDWKLSLPSSSPSPALYSHMARLEAERGPHLRRVRQWLRDGIRPFLATLCAQI
ncbi:hypothetical protein TorRG33x02_238420, partial [Trema orientale]